MIKENSLLEEGYNIDPMYTKEWLADLSALEPFFKVSDEDAEIRKANIKQFTKEHGAQSYDRAMVVGCLIPFGLAPNLKVSSGKR